MPVAREANPVRILADKIELIPIDSVRPHPRNPREGDVGAITQSIEAHGVFKQLLIQKSTGYIIAGNHTWRAEKAKGLKRVPVTYLDVDDDAALQIMLADNQSTDLATNNETKLVEVLQDLASRGKLGGSLFTGDDLDAMMSRLNRPLDLRDIAGQAPMVSQPQATATMSPRVEEAGPETFVQGMPAPVAAQKLDQANALRAQLQGMEELRWQGNNYWGIPELREDMLLEKLPDPLRTWAGQDTPDDGKTTWLYNFGAIASSGIPWDRTILSFFSHDDTFESWWDIPSYYTARAITSGVKMAVLPDFSLYISDPRIVHLYNIYRSQWLGRYFQECGIKVIPRLRFDFKDEETLKIALFGIPRGCPLLIYGGNEKKEDADMGNFYALIQAALDELKPQTFILYGGGPAERQVAYIQEHLRIPGTVLYLKNLTSEWRGSPRAKMYAESRKAGEKAKRSSKANENGTEGGERNG